MSYRLALGGSDKVFARAREAKAHLRKTVTAEILENMKNVGEEEKVK